MGMSTICWHVFLLSASIYLGAAGLFWWWYRSKFHRH